jgi:glutaredoxin-like protein NrdH
MIMVKVYSKPACFQCTATTKEMDRKGISYEVVDITEDDLAFQMVKELGYKQAPVVVAGEDHWSGFRPDKISNLVSLS